MNTIVVSLPQEPISKESLDCLYEIDPSNTQRYQSYLHDESKLTGLPPERIAFPTSAQEVSALFTLARENQWHLVLSGARTGLGGGAVPHETHLLISTERMTGIEKVSVDGDLGTIKARVGTSLRELKDHLQQFAPEWFFPVDPTESSASIGGIVATNASGPRTFFYGAIRQWVQSLECVLPSGAILHVTRGQYRAKNGKFEINDCGTTRTLECGKIEKPETKHTVGYCYEEDVDLIDVIVGSEGTVGCVTEVTFRLEKTPTTWFAHLQFFEDEGQALDYVKVVRESPQHKARAIEWWDERSIKLASGSTSHTLPISKDCEYKAAVLVEYPVYDEEKLDGLYEFKLSILKQFQLEETFSITAIDDASHRQIRAFRHAVPKAVNAYIARIQQEYPSVHKIATDMAVPDEYLDHIYGFYKEGLDRVGLEYAIWGHVGNNHVHVNVLPRNEEEMISAMELYYTFAHEVISLGGAVGAEHGIGRLKKPFLKMQYSDTVIAQMRNIKLFFDPEGRLNPGVLFD